ncbi:MAG: hypothetical protein ING73_14370 [Rhodocyclaceae bacterium]|nr:hypothetical protein [Rhodocyclaceae bacterium]
MGTAVKVIRDFGEFKSGEVIDTLNDDQIASHVKSGDIELVGAEKPVDVTE